MSRTGVAAGDASADQSHEEIQRLVEVHMRRQQLLTAETPPDFWTVIHESTLRHIIGSRSVMVGQLEHIVNLARLRNVTVQVLPYDSGAYPATGPFTVLGFPEQEDPDVVYREGLTDSVFLESAADVSLYTKAFGYLRALALGPERSSSDSRNPEGTLTMNRPPVSP
ncbi:DUF5753 domain-containing protein [Streptomyces atratus]|uniref:DUF5753 domain-containing protein n=1 Tax=Streptomyces atratus TaxID=1893 RepID=UPI0036B2E37D